MKFGAWISQSYTKKSKGLIAVCGLDGQSFSPKLVDHCYNRNFKTAKCCSLVVKHFFNRAARWNIHFAGQAIDQLRQVESGAETIYYMYVVDDDGHLAGVFSLRDLIIASRSTLVEEFMEPHLISVRADASLEAVAQIVAKYNLMAVPVIDEDNIMRGIITVDDAIDIVLPLSWKKRLPKIFG